MKYLKALFFIVFYLVVMVPWLIILLVLINVKWQTKYKNTSNLYSRCPLYQDLAVVVTRVSAIEKREEGFANRNELSGIEKRLERIEDKIDQLR